MLSSCSSQKLQVKAIFLPKFETGALTDNDVGEAEIIYRNHFDGADEYCLATNETLYFKDGLAMCITHEGKSNVAAQLSSILTDSRFDCSDAYIVSIGCAGGSSQRCTFGDVILATATVDLDLGHTADYRDLEDKNRNSTYFHDSSYDDFSCIKLNKSVVDKIFSKTSNFKFNMPAGTRDFILKTMPGYGWENREASVRLGTCVTSDNYWKGKYYECNADAACAECSCTDPFMATEMEDNSVANTARLFNKQDKLIVLRGIVNQDMFPVDSSPEKLWAPKGTDSIVNDKDWDSIFLQTMYNISDVVDVIVDSINAGEF